MTNLFRRSHARTKNAYALLARAEDMISRTNKQVRKLLKRANSDFETAARFLQRDKRHA